MEPVGTGPFKFSLYNGHDTIKLKAKKSWWNSNGIGDKGIKMPVQGNMRLR